MDRHKKRKRTDNGGDRSRHERESSVKANTVVSKPPPPSEAEVNEFFAILRRMNVAVKYLQKNAQIGEVEDSHKRVDLDLNTLPEGGD
uniref:NIMIN2c protein n=1 Tax=Solanum lycopersicum TaxID=4081 RepID=A0A3Q7FV26_SOLLC